MLVLYDASLTNFCGHSLEYPVVLLINLIKSSFVVVIRRLFICKAGATTMPTHSNMTQIASLFSPSAFFRRTANLDADAATGVLRSFLAASEEKVKAISSGNLGQSDLKRQVDGIADAACAMGFSDLSCAAAELATELEALSPLLAGTSVDALIRIFDSTSAFVQSHLLFANIEVP